MPLSKYAGPTRPKARRNLFEGDIAIVELRRRLAETRGSVVPMVRPPATPAYADWAARIFAGYVTVVLVAATTAGAAGYAAGRLGLAIKTARLAASDAAGIEPVPLTPVMMPLMPVAQLTAPLTGVAQFTAPIRYANPPAVNAGRPVAPDPDSPAARAIAAVTAAENGQADLPPMPDIVPRMKLGAELLAAGDVAAARTMFERVAEAGEADGAFALAETYDPTVLWTMPSRGRIAPDAAQARSWYEKARDMGSSTAPERIARLRGASAR